MRRDLRSLLGNYLDLRIAFYLARDQAELRAINDHTEQLQSQLWSAVQTPANAEPNPVTALAVSGMNDVLNSQAHTRRPGGIESRTRHGHSWD